MRQDCFSLSYILYDIALSDAKKRYRDHTYEFSGMVRFYHILGALVCRITSKEADALRIHQTHIERIFADYLVFDVNQQVSEVFFDCLHRRSWTVSTAESVTGGLIASMILEQPGASHIFHQGLITYSDQAKIDLLHVAKETLDNFGVVSPETALAMAVSLQRLTSSDITIASTGYAGPEGGDDTHPVGTIYLGIAVENHSFVIHKVFTGTRNQIRLQASAHALLSVIHYLRKR
ncbi:MAG: CinA family protein [Candidatus Izemoplasmatales bacterium]|nr:CinA family protein [Candidatus Izemoplasmatales bacterium]